MKLPWQLRIQSNRLWQWTSQREKITSILSIDKAEFTAAGFGSERHKEKKMRSVSSTDNDKLVTACYGSQYHIETEMVSCSLTWNFQQQIMAVSVTRERCDECPVRCEITLLWSRRLCQCRKEKSRVSYPVTNQNLEQLTLAASVTRRKKWRVSRPIMNHSLCTHRLWQSGRKENNKWRVCCPRTTKILAVNAGYISLQTVAHR